MSERKLSVLTTEFRDKYIKAQGILLEDHKIVMRQYCTLRDPWEQAKFWRQSRSTTRIEINIRRLAEAGAPWLAEVLGDVGPCNGPPVTGALPGESWHQWGEAADWYWHFEGEAIWDAEVTKNCGGVEVNGYQQAGKVIASVGLYMISFKDQAGRLIVDYPHVQFRKAGSPSSMYTWDAIDQIMKDKFG